ncbi:hypothetical protein [Hyphomicrobium sp. ghe19]|nr:hypothetical protein HYPP_02656 [Hyphomicrobium sp. ghe19]
MLYFIALVAVIALMVYEHKYWNLKARIEAEKRRADILPNTKARHEA